MSLNVEGRKCVVCHSYLFEDDDVVFCPECGAPHHRDCYHAIGKCGLSELHGTADQYKFVPVEENVIAAEKTEKAEKTRHCPVCNQEVDLDAKFCPYCSARLGGVEIQSHMLGFSFFNPDEEIDESVTAKEAAQVITVNSGRYISRFKSINEGKKFSWNWAAFLVPHGWFAFRKMYLISALVTALMIGAALLGIPLMVAQNNSAIAQTAGNYAEAMNNMVEIMMSAGPVAMICSLAGSAINLIVRIISALFADRLYKERVVSAVAEIKKADNREEMLMKKGGVNIFAFALAIMAETLLVQIIGGFFI